MVTEKVIRIRVDASGAERQVKSLDNRMVKLGTDADKTNKSFGALKATVIAVAAALQVRAVSQYADAFTSVQNQIRLTTDSTEELNERTEQLIGVSKRSRSALLATSELFTQITLNASELALSTQEVLDITETVGKSFAIFGKTAAQASGAIRQLNQAFSRGELRGEEFNSVAEGAPSIMLALQKSLNKTKGELIAFAATGGITSKVFIKAVQDSKNIIDLQLAGSVKTLAQSMQEAETNTIAFVGANELVKSTMGVASKAIIGLSNNLDVLQDVVLLTAGMYSSKLIGALSLSIAAKVKAARASVVLAASELKSANEALAAAKINIAAIEERTAATVKLVSASATEARISLVASNASKAKAVQDVIAAKATDNKARQSIIAAESELALTKAEATGGKSALNVAQSRKVLTQAKKKSTAATKDLATAEKAASAAALKNDKARKSATAAINSLTVAKASGNAASIESAAADATAARQSLVAANASKKGSVETIVKAKSLRDQAAQSVIAAEAEVSLAKTEIASAKTSKTQLLAAELKLTEAKKASAIASNNLSAAEIGITSASAKLAEAKTAASVATAELTAAKKASSLASKQLTAANTVAEFSTKKLSLTSRIATASIVKLKAAMAFLGGPLGVALTAATAIAIFATSADDAIKPTNDFTDSITKTAKAMTDLQRGFRITELNIELAPLETELERLKKIAAEAAEAADRLLADSFDVAKAQQAAKAVSVISKQVEALRKEQQLIFDVGLPIFGIDPDKPTLKGAGKADKVDNKERFKTESLASELQKRLTIQKAFNASLLSEFATTGEKQLAIIEFNRLSELAGLEKSRQDAKTDFEKRRATIEVNTKLSGSERLGLLEELNKQELSQKRILEIEKNQIEKDAEIERREIASDEARNKESLAGDERSKTLSLKAELNERLAIQRAFNETVVSDFASISEKERSITEFNRQADLAALETKKTEKTLEFEQRREQLLLNQALDAEAQLTLGLELEQQELLQKQIFEDEKNAIEQDAADERKEIAKAEAAAKIAILSTNANAILGAVAALGARSVKIQKGVAIATSGIAIATGIARAQELGFPANLAEIARVVAVGAKVFQTIRGTEVGSAPSVGGAGGEQASQPAARQEPVQQQTIIEFSGLAEIAAELRNLDPDEVLPVEFSQRIVASLAEFERVSGETGGGG